MKGKSTDTVAPRTEHKRREYAVTIFKKKNCLKSNGKSYFTNIHLGREPHQRGTFTMACRWQIIPTSQYTYAVNNNREIYNTYV